MKINILDLLLSDPSWSIEEAIDIIEFHMKGAPTEVKEEVKEDLKHAFS